MALVVTSLPASAGDTGQVGWEDLLYPLQDSCLENLMERKAWLAIVPSVAQSRTRLKHLAQSRTRLKHLGTLAYQWKRRPDFPKVGGGAQSSGLSWPAKQGSCLIWGSQ